MSVNSKRFKRRPRALVLTYYYSPEPNFITQDVARALADDAGVTVITTHPNFPSGRFYGGFAYWRPMRTQEHGITVWRLPHFPDRSTSKVRRAISYLSFAAIATIFAPFVAGRPVVVWVYHTPFTTALAALFFKWMYGSRLAFTTVDLWPENFSAVGLLQSGRLMRLLYRYRRFINRQADINICCSRSAVQRYLEDGLPHERVCFVPVWVEGIPETLPPPNVRRAERRIVYAGTLGPSQPLDVVVRAAARLLREGTNVAFDIYGSGASENDLRALADSLGATNVHFRGRVSPDEAFSSSAAAFAQIISIRSTPIFRMAIPSKLYLAFAAGTPILGGLEGEAAALVTAASGGVLYDAESDNSFYEAVQRLTEMSEDQLATMSSSMRDYYQTNFCPARLLSSYRRLLLRPDATLPSVTGTGAPR
jgi:glycosyltransferase involved in cell wall biosynthesis